MARRPEVYTVRRRRADDPAPEEKKKRTQTSEGKKPARTAEQTGRKSAGKAADKTESKTEKRTASKGASSGGAAGNTSQRTAGKKNEKITSEKKAADKTAAKKPSAERKTAAKSAAASRRSAQEETPVRRARVRQAEPEARERKSRRTQQEKKKLAAMAADRRRVLSGGGGFTLTLLALLTAAFEAFGLLLAYARGDAQALGILALVVPLGLLTTLVLPRFLPIDRLIMAMTNFLCGVGVVILYTVSPERGARQAVFYAAGLALMLLMSLIVSRLKQWRGITFLAMLLGIGALVLPLAFGSWNNGAKNWVTVPLLGSFQPSEFVKLSVVLAMAYYFSAHRTVFQMMPAILFVGACLLLLMLQRDLGTALIYYATALVLFYAACGNLPLTVIGLGGGAGAAVIGYRMFAHVKVRVAMWRNPWSDPLDKGYQIIQALLAIGSGGLFGVGLGQGTPEKIPAYYNDFIFAVVCEQMGLIFGLLVLAVYVLLIVRGVNVITRSRRSFDMLLGCGVLAMLAIQTFMIVAGVIKMIPLTGVTMPFLSYGGSSLISCLAMIGILHGVSARAQEDMEEDILGA